MSPLIDISANKWHLLGLVLGLYIARYLFRVLKYYRLSLKWGTQPCKEHPQPMLTRIKEMRQASKNGQIMEFNEAQFLNANAHTVRMGLLWQTIYMTKNPENIKYMLSKSFQDWGLGPRSKAFGPLLGHGIFVSDGARWEKSRSLLKPQFSREQISHVRMLEPHVQNFARRIRGNGKNSFNIEPLCHQLTIDASSEFLFGESISSLNFDLAETETEDIRQKKRFDRATDFLTEYLVRRMSLLDFCWLLNSKKFRESVRNVHEFTMSFIDKASKNSYSKEVEKHTNYVLLHELLKQTADREVLRDETLNIMLAGRGTTAGLLAGLIYELSRNKGVWEKLKTEIFAQFGKGDLQEELESITFEKLSRCIYLKHVLNETLRIHPPIAQNVRRAVNDTMLPLGGGKNGESPILIKKGDMVAFQLYSMHRSQEYYGEDADVFRPERWADLSQVKSAFLPFGTGPRVCLGQKYALTEASYVILRLAQIFPNLDFAGSHRYPPLKRNTPIVSFVDGVRVSMHG